jgi:hypothetical protein
MNSAAYESSLNDNELIFKLGPVIQPLKIHDNSSQNKEAPKPVFIKPPLKRQNAMRNIFANVNIIFYFIIEYK